MIGRAEIVAALRDLGVAPDDTMMVHSGMQSAMRVAGASAGEKADAVLDALAETVSEGTLAMPTFSYSFTRGEEFDVERTPSAVGVLGERFRARPGARRTADPIFSSALTGPVPGELEAALFDLGDKECFGDQSVFALLRGSAAKLLFFGVGFGYCTYVHHVEQRAAVGYRYLKDFRGSVRRGGEQADVTARYFVRRLDEDVESFFDPLAEALLERGLAQQASLPKGPRLFITDCAAVERVALERLAENPDFLLRRGHRAADERLSAST